MPMRKYSPVVFTLPADALVEREIHRDGAVGALLNAIAAEPALVRVNHDRRLAFFIIWQDDIHAATSMQELHPLHFFGSIDTHSFGVAGLGIIYTASAIFFSYINIIIKARSAFYNFLRRTRHWATRASS